MPFDQSTITAADAVRTGADLLVRWTSTAAAGTPFQVYLGGRLAWRGTARSCVLPYPSDAAGSRLAVDVGAVLPAEASTDFSASLPARGYADRPTLSWYGGTYLADDLAGFAVYRGATAGAAVSYAARVGTVPAYPQGIINDGAGVGEAGRGGAGRAASAYAWTAPAPLAAGTWYYGVRPVDAAGDEGTTSEVAYVATAPPGPPAPDAAGRRLTVTYDPATRIATLAWLPPA